MSFILESFPYKNNKQKPLKKISNLLKKTTCKEKAMTLQFSVLPKRNQKIYINNLYFSCIKKVFVDKKYGKSTFSTKKLTSYIGQQIETFFSIVRSQVFLINSYSFYHLRRRKSPLNNCHLLHFTFQLHFSKYIYV